jgi:hypothetical protein
MAHSHPLIPSHAARDGRWPRQWTLSGEPVVSTDEREGLTKDTRNSRM